MDQPSCQMSTKPCSKCLCVHGDDRMGIAAPYSKLKAPLCRRVQATPALQKKQGLDAVGGTRQQSLGQGGPLPVPASRNLAPHQLERLRWVCRHMQALVDTAAHLHLDLDARRGSHAQSGSQGTVHARPHAGHRQAQLQQNRHARPSTVGRPLNAAQI